MNTHRSCGRRVEFVPVVTRYLPVLLSAAIVVSLGSRASAGLMNSTYNVRLTGPVAEGSSTSMEVYSANNIPFDGSGVGGNGDSVPNVLSPTPAPNPFTSTTTRIDRIFEPTGGTATSGTATFWILGPPSNSTKAFGNSLDPTKLVELEISSLKWDNLPVNQKIVVNNFKLDKGLFYDPVTLTITGTGSVANPLSIVAKFNPSDVNRITGNGVKVQFDFGTQTVIIPEPATFALVGILGLGFVWRRGRRSLHSSR